MNLDSRAEELLHAIRESPDDDAPRLVFADHIADRWPAHAAWIVAECSGTNDRTLHAAFRAELPPALRDIRTHRGFADTWEWHFEERNFLEIDADDLFRLAPWCKAITLDDVSDVDAVAARMHRFDALALSSSLIADPRDLVTAPGLAHLRAFAVRHMQVAPVFAEIVRATSFVDLEHLELDGEHAPDDLAEDAFRALVDAPFATTLKALDVCGYRFQDLVDVVARLPAVRELDASSSTIDARFAALPHRLTSLFASGCGIDNTAAGALAGSSVLSELGLLAAFENLWSAEGLARVLAACGPLTQLSADFTDQDGAVLGGVFRHLRARSTLEIMSLYGGLGPAGTSALAATDLPRLRRLQITDFTMADGLLALARAPFLRQLEVLNLTLREVTLQMAHLLADGLGSARLVICGKLAPTAEDLLRERLGSRLTVL